MRIVCMKSNITNTNWERENAIYEILPTNLALKILLVPLFAMLTQAFFSFQTLLWSFALLLL